MCVSFFLGVEMVQRFGNMAGLFQVMAFGVRALNKGNADHTFMSKLAKIATSEMISSKVDFTFSTFICLLCNSLTKGLFVIVFCFQFSIFFRNHNRKNENKKKVLCS